MPDPSPIPEDSLYHYRFTVERVLDGDTLEGEIDYGLRKYERKLKIRLVECWAPEKTGKTKQAGLASKAALERLLGPLPRRVMIRTLSDKVDSFGRLLATVWVGTENLNARMVELKMATRTKSGK